jgi:hypothetical protein
MNGLHPAKTDMKIPFFSSMVICLLGMSLVTACGGGAQSTPVQSTAAVLTLSTSVKGSIPSSTAIASYDVTVTLPAGVTVRSTTRPPLTDAGVVTAVGKAAGSLVTAVYSAQTRTQAGTVKIYLISPAGFSAGEFGVVNCDIAAGADILPLDFATPTLDDATGLDSSTGSTVLGLEQQLSLTSTVVIR